MFKAVEAFIFCLVFTGGGNFLSIYYEIGQPGMWFLLGVLMLAPFAVISGKKIIFSSTLFMLLISSLGYLFSFFLDVSNIAGLSIFVMIKTNSHESGWAKKFESVVSNFPEIMGAHRMAGDLDYILRVRVKDVSDYDKFYQNLISKISISEISASFVMDDIKDTTALPTDRM